eukprot:gene5952-6399_t
MSMQSNKGSNKAAQRKNSIITIPIAAPAIPRATTDHNNTPPGKSDARRSSLNSFHHPSSVIRAFTSHFSMISNVSSISEVMNVYHHAVVGVSANSDDETVNDAMTAGLDAFMPKPFTNDVFNTTVLKVLQSINKR